MKSPAQRFAVLQLSGVALLVPLAEVYSLESALDVDRTRRSDRSVGAIRSAGDWFPVFCLSDDLDALDEIPDSFKVCAVLAASNMALALACRSVSTLDSTALQHHPLPASMHVAGSPVRSLAFDGERIFCHTSLTDLVPLMESAA